jgi:hypothetical protein
MVSCGWYRKARPGTSVVFEKNPVARENQARYDLCAGAGRSEYRASVYVSDVDDFHERSPTCHAIPVLGDPRSSEPGERTEFWDVFSKQMLLYIILRVDPRHPALSRGDAR